MNKETICFLNNIDFESSAEVYEKISSLFEENQELKKQLNEKITLEMKLKEELEDKRKEYQEVYKDVREEIKDYKNQQKEFIEWLENKLVSELDVFTEAKVCDILSKYKEIIGGDNE